MKTPSFLYLVTLIFLGSCTTASHPEDIPYHSTTPTEQEEITPKKETTSQIESTKLQEPTPQVPEWGSTAFLDEVYQFISKWNTAINEKDMASLEKMYVDKTTYYGQVKSVEDINTQQKQFSEKNPNYKQSIEQLYIDFSNKDSILICDFEKKYAIHTQKEQSTQASLHLKRHKDSFIIITETDVPSIIKSIKKTPPTDLPYGEYTFEKVAFFKYSSERWEEYVTTIYINYSATNTEINYNLAGPAGTHMDRFVKNASIKNGLLNFSMATTSGAGYLAVDEVPNRHFKKPYTFKIIGQHSLVQIATPKGGEYNLGETLFIKK